MNLQSLDNNLRELTKEEAYYKTYKQSPLVISEDDGNEQQKVVKINDSLDNECEINHNKTETRLLKSRLQLNKISRFREISIHTHTWIEFIYAYSGNIELIIKKKKIQLQKGQICAISENVPHSIGMASENDIMISCKIDPIYFDSVISRQLSGESLVSYYLISKLKQQMKERSYLVFHSEKRRRIPIFMNEFLCEYFDPSLNSINILHSFFSLILSELINVYENDISKEIIMQSGKCKVTLTSILRYVEANYKSCTLESTANFFEIHPNYLTTMLKQRMGLSYKELVVGEKLKQAAVMLRQTELTIKEIASEIGYDNISFFYKKFQQRYECSPKEYRMTYQKVNIQCLPDGGEI